MAKAEQVRIDLVAKDDASKTIDKVADKAEELEKLDPEVQVGADTSKAEGELKGLLDDVQALAKADAEIVLKAKVDSARADLKQLQAEMRETADTARAELSTLGADADTSGLTRVADEGGRARSAMANMTGNVASELGELSGVGGIAAQSIGELAEAAGEGELKLGQLAKVAGPMAGLAVAMTVMQEAMSAANASKAFDAERVERYTKALEEGVDPMEAFVANARELGRIEVRTHTGGGLLGLFSATKDLIPVLADAGISVEEFGDMVKTFGTKSTDEWRAALEAQGVSMLDAITITKAARDENAAWADSAQLASDKATVFATSLRELGGLLGAELPGAIGGAIDGMADWARETGRAADKQADAEDAARDLKAELGRLETQLDDIKGALDMEQALADFGASIATALDISDDAGVTEQQIRDIKASIISLGETANTNPAVIKSQLDMVDQGDLNAVAWNVGTYYARNPVGIATKLLPPVGKLGVGQGNQITIQSLPPTEGGGGAPVVNVTQVLPRGWRGDPVAQMAGAARRSGGLYRRTRR